MHNRSSICYMIDQSYRNMANNDLWVVVFPHIKMSSNFQEKQLPRSVFALPFGEFTGNITQLRLLKVPVHSRIYWEFNVQTLPSLPRLKNLSSINSNAMSLKYFQALRFGMNKNVINKLQLTVPNGFYLTFFKYHFRKEQSLNQGRLEWKLGNLNCSPGSDICC